MPESNPLQSSSGSSADTYRSRTLVQDTELERGIVRTCPRVCAAAFARTTPCTISVCTVWVRAKSFSVDRRRDDFKPNADRILSGRIPRVEVCDLDITGGKSVVCDRHKT